MSPPRREFTVAVLACVLGAALALLSATRTWTVEVTGRAAPLAPLRSARSGSSLEPWLTALALVALAGAGALLATRARVAVGAVLLVSGAGVLAGAVHGLVTVAHIQPVWPAVALAGAVLIGYGGAQAVRRGRRWPAMGARYDRPDVPRTPAEDRPQHIGPSRSDVAMWDALDRGEDPTRRSE